MRTGALNPLSRYVRQPAPLTFELVSTPVKVEASDIRRSEHFLFGLGPPSEDISEDSLEGLAPFAYLISEDDWLEKVRNLNSIFEGEELESSYWGDNLIVRRRD